MLSKEEIEKEKQQLRCIHLVDRNSDNLCKAIKRAEQLELDKQKLIEQLEDWIETEQELLEFYENDYWKGSVDRSQEILEILKGEKE